MQQIQFLDADNVVIAERGAGVSRDAGLAAYEAACRRADAGTCPEGTVIVAFADDGKVQRRHRVKERPQAEATDAEDREAAEGEDVVRERAADSAGAAGRDAAAASGKTGGRAANAATTSHRRDAKPKRD